MMNRKISVIILALTLSSLLFAGCAQTAANKANSANSNKDAAIKSNAQPIADDEIAIIETDWGTFKIEFYSNIAPKAVARFKELAREGVYNGTSFHRVNPNLGMIQGGDPLSKDNIPANVGTGKSDKPNVPAEFSDILFDKGIVGAARERDGNDTANSQFFIMTKRQQAFDKRYTVFGKVIEDPSNTVNLIAGAPTAPNSERPEEKITVKSVTIQKR
jgi:peptidylprolyl isomerase